MKRAHAATYEERFRAFSRAVERGLLRILAVLAGLLLVFQALLHTPVREAISKVDRMQEPAHHADISHSDPVRKR